MGEGRKPLLFVSNAGVGVFNPLCVIAAELARRGTEDLWFATDESRRAEVEKIDEGSGVRFASLGETDPEQSPSDWDDEMYRQVTQRSRWKAHRAVVRRGFSPESGKQKYLALDALVEELNPALMIFDSLHSVALLVALKRKIPFALSSPFMPSNLLIPRGFPMLHTGLPLNMSFPQRVRNTVFKLRAGMMFLHPKMLRRVLEGASKVRQGLLPREILGLSAKVDHADLVLCYTVFGLEYPFPVPDKFHLVGAMIPPLPEAPDDDDLSGWLDANPSVVYIGLGTITRLTRHEVHALVEVARRLDGRHAVLWKLPTGQQHLLPPRDELPPNLRIESWVPSQLDVLAHPSVKLFFNHGGGNAFHEGLYFGKPQVIRPLWVDCYDQAVRGVDSGVSLTVNDPQTIDVDDVIDKITQVLGNPAFRERAEFFAKVQHEAGGVRAAADLILGNPALK
ncbi:glycosyltransferase [Streptosporangium sp. NBC_01755]|uniref:glycosyltransferase n=1 Tax=unclassified Streptosporangium TaxID=2632669 RepID=UPI002DD9FCC7|nr:MULTISPECIES: glycosyltransferase [unclassified Streptosporangium]WSA29365.1 glycosyltransferase [Streptosporangium sp. NBC_01810]WSC99191.1 glycosyltransferase [Streptosporangium sp. NBC_01755]